MNLNQRKASTWRVQPGPSPSVVAAAESSSVKVCEGRSSFPVHQIFRAFCIFLYFSSFYRFPHKPKISYEGA